MSKPTIVIDIDDVLSETNEAMRLHVNDHFGTNHQAEHFEVPGPYFGYWERVWRVSDEEANQRYQSFTSMGMRRRLAVTPGAIEGIQKLKKHFKLVIVTSREQSSAEDTHHWLDRHFPNTFHGVTFMPNSYYSPDSHSKADICKELGAEYLLDDAFEHCEKAAQEGIECLLFGKYGWNQHQELPPHITRVHDWSEVLEYFDEKRGK